MNIELEICELSLEQMSSANWDIQGGQGFGHQGFGQGFGHARNARHETRFWAPEMPKTINLKSIMQNLLKMYNFL